MEPTFTQFGFGPIKSQPKASGVQVRKMIQSDSEFVGALTVEAFESKVKWAVRERNVPGAKRLYGQSLKEGNPADYNRVLVATYGGRPAGICALKFHGDDELGSTDISFFQFLSCYPLCRLWCMSCILASSVSGGDCLIDQVCVDANFRGKGVGKALMGAADNEGKSRGCKNMCLYVAKENRAKNLYEREGYTITDTVDGYCCYWCAVGVRHFYKMEKPLI